jgi:tRNA threonylcarbamoyladenosine biosynthesis protein TsaB
MGEVYAAAFEVREGDAIALDAERVGAPGTIELPGDEGGWHGVGTGFAAQERLLATRLHERLAVVDAAALPRAADVARLAVLAYARGEAVAAEFAEPAYLRNNVALTMAEQQALRDSR